MLIQRRLLIRIREALASKRLVLVEGSPRSGKTTLAGQLVRAGSGAILLDARGPGAANLLRDPRFALAELGFGLRVLVLDNADEETAAALAGLAGEGGQPRLVLFGPRFPDSLAAAPGVLRLSLGGLSLLEVGRANRARHWLRGGYPEAYGAAGDEAALAWLARYADSIAEERFAQAGLPWAPGRTRSLLSMLARSHGSPLNESAVARSLGVSRPTVARAVAALGRSGLSRILPSLGSASGKRVQGSGAFYLRDSGLLHALLGIAGTEGLLGNAALAASFEGYAIEEALALLPEGVEAARYRTQDGAGLELVFLREGKPVAAAALRWAREGGPGKGALLAARDVGAPANWLVLPESEERELPSGFTALGLARFLELVQEL